MGRVVAWNYCRECQVAACILRFQLPITLYGIFLLAAKEIAEHKARRLPKDFDTERRKDPIGRD